MTSTFYQNLATTSIICAILVLLYFKWCYKYWGRKKIPFVAPTIPNGNLENPLNLKIGLGLRVAELYAEFKRNGWKQGGIYSATKPIYVPVDLDYVKNVLAKDFQHFTGRGLYHNEKTDPLSAHLFRVDGQKWKNLRTKITPTFTSGKMKAMFQTVLDCGKQMKQALDEACLESVRTFDIKEIAGRFTTDVIGSCAFGLDCNSFKDPNSEFRRFGKKVFGPNLEEMVKTFLAMCFPNVCRRLGMKILATDVTTFFTDVFREVVEYRQSKAIRRNDFVQLVLEMKGGASLTFQEMTAQAFVFFVAGFETSSSTMAFCLYQLAKNPEIQEKVRREIQDVTSKCRSRISYEGIQEMKYMTQVIEETLRMYPTLLILNRICTKDYVLPEANTILEKGTPVFIPVYGIHHDSEYYPNPERFDPDRLSAEAKAERHSFAFLPFGEGPRNCIGLRFGMMQARIGLAILLKHFRFSLNPKTPPSLTIDPKTFLLASVENILLDAERINK